MISAALDLSVERGFSATRLEDVAARAGVSTGTLYLCFPSREDLFKTIVRGGIVPAIERAERLLDEHRGSADFLIRDMVNVWWVSVGNARLGGIPKLMISESRNFPELTQFYLHEVISPASTDWSQRQCSEESITESPSGKIGLCEATRHSTTVAAHSLAIFI